MNRLYSTPAWPAFRRKLKQRFPHLSGKDLAGVNFGKGDWLENLQRTLGRSTLEIARLAEEAAEEQGSRWSLNGMTFARSEEYISRLWPTAEGAFQFPAKWEGVSL